MQKIILTKQYKEAKDEFLYWKLESEENEGYEEYEEQVKKVRKRLSGSYFS